MSKRTASVSDAPLERTPRRTLARVAAGLALAWVLLAVVEVRGTGDDWRIFWHVGHVVGGPALFAAHFVYVPGAAWLLWPFAHLPPVVGYFFYAATLIAAGIGAARLAATVYGLSFEVAVAMTFAWFPFTVALCLGQNSPIALLFVMLAIWGVVRKDEAIAGIAVGLLLYKPTDAIALLLVLALFRYWRALGCAALCAAGWYLLSVGATGDWLWPVGYFHTVVPLYRSDIALNSDFAISVPVFLYRAGLPTAVSWFAAALMLCASAPLLVRARRLNAVSVAPLLALAASPHAWGYEAVLVLPAMWLAISQAYRRAVLPIAAAYVVAPLYFFSRQIHFDVLAVVVLGGTAIWVITSLTATRSARRAIAQAATP